MTNTPRLFGETHWCLLQAVLLTVLFTSIPGAAAAQTSAPDASTPKTAREFIKVMGDLYRSDEGTKDLQDIGKRFGISFDRVVPKDDGLSRNSVHEARSLASGVKLLEWRFSVLDFGPVPQDSISLSQSFDSAILCLRIEDIKAATGLFFPLPHPRVSSHTRIENSRVLYQSYLSRDLRPLRNIGISADFDEQRCATNLSLNERIFHQGEKK